jgi:hypothetical protein
METTDFVKVIRNMRMIVIVTVVSAFIACTVFAFLYVKLSSDNSDKIYVVTDAGSFMAKRNEYALRYDYEVKNHVRLFFQNLFEADQYTYTQNLESALNLIDNVSGRKVYDQMQRSGFYDIYKKENAHTKILVDEIKVNMDSRPIKAKILLRQQVYWAGYTKEVNYGAIMDVVEDNRSEKNPFGLMITSLNFINYAPETTPKDSIQ